MQTLQLEDIPAPDTTTHQIEPSGSARYGTHGYLGACMTTMLWLHDTLQMFDTTPMPQAVRLNRADSDQLQIFAAATENAARYMIWESETIVNALNELVTIAMEASRDTPRPPDAELDQVTRYLQGLRRTMLSIQNIIDAIDACIPQYDIYAANLAWRRP